MKGKKTTSLQFDIFEIQAIKTAVFTIQIFTFLTLSLITYKQLKLISSLVFKTGHLQQSSQVVVKSLLSKILQMFVDFSGTFQLKNYLLRCKMAQVVSIYLYIHI